jgi:hypothetical protein
LGSTSTQLRNTAEPLSTSLANSAPPSPPATPQMNTATQSMVTISIEALLPK